MTNSDVQVLPNGKIDPLLAEPDTTLAIAVEGANTKSSKKKKKSGKSDKGIVLETTNTLDPHVSEPAIEPVQIQTSDTEQHPEVTEKVSRRRKRSSVVDIGEVPSPHLHGAPNAKTLKKKRAEVDDDQVMDSPSPDVPVSKKRKTTPLGEIGESRKPQKDKKRKHSKYPDPFEDAELPEHSQKCI